MNLIMNCKNNFWQIFKLLTMKHEFVETNVAFIGITPSENRTFDIKYHHGLSNRFIELAKEMFEDNVLSSEDWYWESIIELKKARHLENFN